MERYALHVGNIGQVRNNVSLTEARRVAATYRAQARTRAMRAEWPVWIERLSDGEPVEEWDERTAEECE